MKKLGINKSFMKAFLSILLPITAQNLISSTLSVIDSFMVGLMGETELAAVTMANTPFFVVMIVIFGVQSGCGVLIAQYWGKQDEKTVSRVAGVGIYFSLAISVTVTLVAIFNAEWLVGIVSNNDELLPYAAAYARVVAASYVFNGISGILINTYRCAGDTKPGLYIYAFSTILNTFLNWIFIFGKLGAPALGVEGAALATTLSRMVELVITILVLRRRKSLKLHLRYILRPGLVITKDFFKYGSFVVLNETLWSVGYSMYSVILGHMPGSTAILAAYTISGNVDRLLQVVTFACSNAAAIMVGNEVGKRDAEGAYRTAGAINGISVFLGAIAGLLLLIIRFTIMEPLVYPLFDLSAEAAAIANTMLLIMVIASPAKAFNTTNVVGVLRGGGDVKFGAILDVSVMYFLSVPLAALSGLVFNWGITAVYICLNGEEVLKMIFGIPRFLSKKWIKNVTRDMD